jgi:hypothetical protein
MPERALKSARVVALGVVVAVAIGAGLLFPGVAEAQGTAVKPTAAAKPAQPPARPAAAPAAAPAVPVVTPPPGAVSPQQTIAAAAGTWDGVAQTPNGDMAVRMVLVHQGGKLTGAMDTPLGALTVTGSTLTADVLELGFELQGSPGVLSGKLSGDKYEGSWSTGSDSGPFALVRTPAGGARPGAPAPAAVADPISGEWSGETSVGGLVMPFTLIVKLSGETVAGEIVSGAGDRVPLTTGAWKDATLQITFPYTGGEPVAMRGQIVEGKLTGVVDYNRSEMQGTWSAIKK